MHLDVVWTLRRSTPWARRGHVVGIDQLDLGSPRPTPGPPLAPTRPHASTEGTPENVAWDVGALEWAPTLFRALTDNDGLKQGWTRGHLGNLDRWITRQGLDRYEWIPGPSRRRRADGTVVTTTSGELRAPGVAAPVVVRRRLVDHGDGWVHITTTLRVPDELADPPRVGTEWVLPGSLSRVEWFGEGPHECYPDRRASARVGRWTSAVDDMYEDYVVPQEHGHRSGCRWLALRGTRTGRGAAPGLLVVADPTVGDGTLGVAARRHGDHDLWACTHTDELVALTATRPTRTYLYLDAAQRGLGTASCGPDALDEYRIGGGTHTVSVWCRSFAPADEDPGELARRVASPGGTTQAGLDVLDAGGAMAALAEATLRAARDRSAEMAREARGG